MSRFYVYKYIRSRKSKYGDMGTPYYIGKGINGRIRDNRRTIKPPIDKTKIQIISENMSEVDAFQAEILLIYLYGRIDIGAGILRNRTNGGEGVSGYIHSLLAKKKMSINKKGKRPWNKGIPHSEETKKKISQNHADVSGKNHPLFGKHRSEETKKKISNNVSGSKHPNYGKHQSKETKNKMSLLVMKRKRNPNGTFATT